MNMLLKGALPVAIALSLAACNGTSSNVSMTLEATNLEALGADYDYEGWIIVNGTPVSTGTFDIVNGITEPSSFTVDRAQAKAADTFVLTIEPAVDPDSAPSATKILAGPITDGISNIVTDHPAAFNSDFSDDETKGTFILATPSNGPDTANQGIWYLVPPAEGADGPTAALTLPELPIDPDTDQGWRYEGWVVTAGGPVSTGTFKMPNGEDSDGAGGDLAGPLGFPPFPGQDFISPEALELIGGDTLVGLTSVISVEPYPDNSPAPFSMKPLSSLIEPADNVLEHDSGATLPSGTVTINF